MADIYALTLPVITHPWLDCESPLRLPPDSPKILLRSVGKLAYYFKREMHFDFVQFEANEAKGAAASYPMKLLCFLSRRVTGSARTSLCRYECSAHAASVCGRSRITRHRGRSTGCGCIHIFGVAAT